MKKLLLIPLLGFSLSTWAIECPNHEYVDGKCVEKKETLVKRTKQECNCGEDEFIAYNILRNACHCTKCSEEHNPSYDGGWLSALGTDKEECAKCPHREYVDGRCFLKECPKGKFRGKDEGCLSCDDLSDHENSKEDCSVCSNREYKNNKCVLKKCPEGYFRNIIGSCIPCDGNSFRINWGGSVSKVTEESSKKECDKCPNRKYVGKECILSKKQ